MNKALEISAAVPQTTAPGASRGQISSLTAPPRRGSVRRAARSQQGGSATLHALRQAPAVFRPAALRNLTPDHIFSPERPKPSRIEPVGHQLPAPSWTQKASPGSARLRRGSVPRPRRSRLFIASMSAPSSRLPIASARSKPMRSGRQRRRREAAGSARPAPVARGDDCRASLLGRRACARGRPHRPMQQAGHTHRNGRINKHPCKKRFPRARGAVQRPSTDSPHSSSRVRHPRPPPRPPRHQSAIAFSSRWARASRPAHISQTINPCLKHQQSRQEQATRATSVSESVAGPKSPLTTADPA